MDDAPAWRDAVLKVLLALVPSLMKALWDHWPKTPPERRAHELGSGDDAPQRQEPTSP